jgi:hypothetical protein
MYPSVAAPAPTTDNGTGMYQANFFKTGRSTCYIEVKAIFFSRLSVFCCKLVGTKLNSKSKKL